MTARDAPGSTSDLTITYDSNGRVTSQALPGATTSFTYDGASRLATRSDTFNGLSWQSGYAYDTLDRLTELTYPSGRVVGYTYDAGSRLAGVTQQGQIFADGFSYTDSGQLDSFRTGSIVQTLSYDSRKRIQRLTAGADLDLTYTYDRTSNVLGINDGRPGEDQSFDYDSLGRLTDATGAWGQLAWTYDAAGNRLSETGSAGAITYAYSAPTQRLTSTAGGASESFSYDAIGRLTADGRGTYTYTPTSRLAAATTPAGQATYGYTPEAFRIATVLNDGPPTYTIRGVGQAVLHEQGTTVKTTGPPDERLQVWTRELIYGGGRLLGAVRDAGPEFYATDALGSIRVVFDATGAVVGRSDYLPFGEALNVSGELPAQRFTGQERDEEGGLDYFNARMYQPRTGRLNAVDPLFLGAANPQDWNRYAYVRNNPLAFTDPSGASLCQQSSGAYWCPQYSSGPYQGGELDSAEATYNNRVTMRFMQVWVENSHGQSLAERGLNAAQQAGLLVVRLLEAALLGTVVEAPVLDSERADAKPGAKLAPELEQTVDTLLMAGVLVGRPKFGRYGGESAAAALGRRMHREWEWPSGFRTEFRLPSGKRVDAVNLSTKQVFELKPNNPNAIRRGERQLRDYVNELDEHSGCCFTGTVITY